MTARGGNAENPGAALGEVGLERFMTEFWQRQPLLISQAFPAYRSPLDGNELAGLAMEEDVEARLVFEQGREGPWELRHGPFSEQELRELPPHGWTLLVQAVDHFVPEVAALKRCFEFLPSYRLDDVMLSFAVPGGSVGPHFDYYDVFLLQGQGRRRWQVGGRCDAATPTLQGTPLMILQDFSPRQEWTLQPGDMLYLPPGVAHWGIALEDSVTVSIGFRAPSQAEYLAALADHAMSTLPADRRYTDPEFSGEDRPGQVSEAAIDRVQEMALNLCQDRDLLAGAFGRLMTERKYPPQEPFHPDAGDAANWRSDLARGARFVRNTGARFAYRQCGDTAQLFVDGEQMDCELALAQLLCTAGDLDDAALRPFLRSAANVQLLSQLLLLDAIRLD